jgi:transmembrane sensor
VKELFIRYLNNQCTPEEVQQLLRYFNEPANEAGLRQLVEEALLAPVEEQPQPVLDEVYENITRQIQGERVRTISRRRFIQVAAAAAVLIVGFSWFLMRVQNAATPVMRQLATAKGQRLQHRLSDGTIIWLGPGSQLQYPASFNGAQREVTLRGEAFFEVAHDAAHPFIVHTGDLHTRVLGTSFNIQAYDDQPAVAVTLVTGKVLVNSNNQQLQLAPNQRALLQKTSGQLTKQDDPDAAQMLTRREGLLSYKGMALQSVIRDLELSYNVTISIPPAIRACTYYGQLNTRTALSQVLKQIALTYNASTEQKSNHWEIINGTCNN